MTTIALILATLGQFNYASSAKTPVISHTPRDPESPATYDPSATTAVLAPPPSAKAAPPVIVQFHEDAATKADINALGSKLDAMLTPLDHRLAAVESKTDALTRDVIALKVARETPPAPPAAPKPPPTLWELYDATGVRCTGHDREELIARVQQRNAWFAAQATRQRVVEPAPMFAMPSLEFGGFAAPMFGGGFTGGGCAGGNCR